MGIYIGIFFFFLGQILGWFQLNSQYLSEWWRDKPVSAAFIIGVPTSIAFWYAWRMIVEATGSVWTARFIGSSTGLIIFPILTWFLLGESMFTAKTVICLGLAILIILIQLFY
tara:strand:- start:818 stop:1156 length:339 start_codon:yes stop_codon:yes gene_type:complete